MWNARGVINGKLGKYVEAFADFSVARKQDPSNENVNENFHKIKIYLSSFMDISQNDEKKTDSKSNQGKIKSLINYLRNFNRDESVVQKNK